MNTASLRSHVRRIGPATVLMAGAVLLASACTPLASASPSDVPDGASASASGPAPSAEPSSVVGLPGWLYYADDAGRLVRLTTTGPVPVLATGAETANVSPDGTAIAFLDGRNVIVTDRNGHNRRTVFTDGPGMGYEPYWSPDSRQLLVTRGEEFGPRTYGTLTLATGTFTPLPHQLDSGLHPLWSADGRHLGYATGECRIGTADIDGANPRLVPVFGTDDPANTRHRKSCDPYSISPDGRYIAIDQRTDDQPLGDIARGTTANTIIDTRTGNNITLPVTGTITQILYRPDGTILVRTKTNTTTQLTLLNPDHTTRSSIVEPPTVRTFALLTHTN